LLFGLLAPVAWPWLHPVPAWPGPSDGPLTGLLDGLAGLAAGAAMGGLAAVIPPRLPRERAFTLAATSAGCVLGWQAAIAVVAAAVVAHRLARLAAGWLPVIDRIPALAWLGAVALAWILAWNYLSGWWLVAGR
jgi:hypothetical protein